MPKRAVALTDKQVRALRAVGLHSVGGPVPGLALQITQTPGNAPARSWVLRAMVAGQRRALGLGPYPSVSLATARLKAEAIHRDIRENRDPFALKQQERAKAVAAAARAMSFQMAAEQFIEERRQHWKNAKHIAQWESTLKAYAYPVIGEVQVADVDKAMVLKIVKPIWATKTETANRVRDRIKLVLNWAKAHGLRDGENPAEWRGHLEHALPAREIAAVRGHQPALPVHSVGAFVARLRTEQKDIAAKALEFAILTAARDGEVRGATWSEIDLDSGIWAIPADRMKAARGHRVPLSPAAIKLLKALPRLEDNPHVFPGSSRLGRLSENTLNVVIKRLHAREQVPSDAPGRPAVVHGMRATFRNWGRERTDFRPELLELSLAHTVGNAVERAYARDDALEQRRSIMVAWARFVSKPEEPARANGAAWGLPKTPRVG
jgi:integrase